MITICQLHNADHGKSGNTEMKITIKHMIVAASLVISAQAHAAGFSSVNSAGLSAGGAVRTCMGSNGHPDSDGNTENPECKVVGLQALHPITR